MKGKFDVFISYRRDKGGSELALLMYSQLREYHKLNPFMDVKVLKNHTFGPQIMDAIKAAPVFMFILSEDSLTRCINEDDWVRKEILYAVSLGKQIIPVNPNGRFKTFPEGLPSEIYAALSDNQQSEIHLGQLFEQSVGKMVNERILPFFRGRRVFKAACVCALVLALFCLAGYFYMDRIHKDCLDQYGEYWNRYLQTQDPVMREKADSCWNRAEAVKPFLLFKNNE